MPEEDPEPMELIPDSGRALYESLVTEGSRPLDPPALVLDPAARSLIERGLAWVAPDKWSALVAVSPSAAFERLFVRWLDAAVEVQHKIFETCGQAIAVQHHLLRVSDTDLRSICHLVVEVAQVAALHSSLSRAAQRQTCTWATGPYGEGKPVEEAPPRHGFDPGWTRYLPPDPTLLRKGGTAYAVYDASVIAWAPPNVLADSYADGEEIRVREQKLPMKLLIVDDHTVLVPLGPYGHPALFIRSKSLVALFQRFYDLVWEDATPWTPGTTTSRPEADSRSADRILDLMAAGLKDEAIARRCGVSVRTVRRHIAQIMSDLGARHRFAAGVAAVRQGWVASPG